MKKGLFQKNFWMKGMLTIMTCAAVFCMCGFVSEAATGKVTGDTVKIRKEASTDSDVVGSTSNGKTVDIVGAVKDASGTVWYKVPNGNNSYGYIRSDLIETNDSIQVSEAPASESSSSSETANKPAETVPTSIGEMKATISAESIRVRSGASTQHDTVTSLKQGTEITLIGEATDSAGNKWYQMTCEKDGRTINGYVRYDLITISDVTEEGTEGENAEGAEGENPEEMTEQPPVEQPADPEHNDYEIVYNEEQYWLYNNIDSTMMRVEDLLTVVNTANENNAALQEQVKSNKVIIIILAVIIVLLVVGLTLLIFKLRDFYYEDYEGDYDEEEEPAPVQRRRPASDDRYEREEKPVRQRPMQDRPQRPSQKMQGPSGIAPQRTGEGRTQRAAQSAPQRQAQDNMQKPVSKPELQAAERMQPEKKTAPRKSQNFLLDDDEFEFEFLNMDDKDL